VTYLKKHHGDLSFSTNAWMLPNHKAFIEMNGKPIFILLDLVEDTESHSRINLAVTFAKILDDCGISEKVSNLCT